MDARQKLKSKLKKKREQRTSGGSGPGGDLDIMDMLKNVNSILQTNPQMVRQVSKAVESMMGNQQLMDSLKNQIQHQTRDNNDAGEQPEASGKDITQ
jgi:hypothetical protein